MRIFILLILLFFSSLSFGQTPDYFANDPKWVCKLWDSNQCGSPFIPSTSTYVYYLNGDTIIGSHTYHLLFTKGEEIFDYGGDTIPFNHFTGYYLRQENKSIRFIYDYYGWTDSLLVSYDYQVGDTVRGDYFQNSYSTDTIQKIDSVLVNTEFRRVFYLDTIEGPVIIEGIGYKFEPWSDLGEFIAPIVFGIGWGYFINCFGFGDTPYWDPYGTGGNCYLNVDIEESEAAESGIYPNPFNTNLNVRSVPGTDSEIILYDILGREVMRKSFFFETQIPTSDFENRIIKYGKVLKNGD